MTEQPTPGRNLRWWLDACSIGVAFSIAAAGFVWLITDYDCNYPSCEIPNRMLYGTGVDEPAGWRDFGRAFDWFHHEMGFPRARFLSYFLENLNFRFRFFLWQYITPHPTLSFVWLFSLASLAILYKAARELGFTRAAAACAVAVYATSIGFLSGIAHLDHPAKPMDAFYVISVVYFYSRLHNRSPNLPIASQPWRAIVLGAAIVFFGLFLDEACVLVFAVVPALCPMLFLPRRVVEAWHSRTSTLQFIRRFIEKEYLPVGAQLLVFFIPALLYLVCMLFVVPFALSSLGYRPEYDFLAVVFRHMGGSRGGSLLLVPINFVSLLSSSFLLEVHAAHHYDVIAWVVPRSLSSTSIAVVVLLLLFFMAAARDCFIHQKVLFMKVGAALFVAVVFATMLFSVATDQGTITGFYYGNQFAIFWALLAGLLLNATGSRLHLIGRIVLIAVVVLQTFNAHQMCRESQGMGCFYDELAIARRSYPEPIVEAYPQVEIAFNSNLGTRGVERAIADAYPRGLPNTKPEIVKIWREWQRDRDSVERISEPISRSSYWLICELSQINKIERRLESEAK